MKLVPVITQNKDDFYKRIVKAGGEGTMEKDGSAIYTASTSRTKAMYKRKRHEEVDAWVSGFIPGEEGWTGLVGALNFSVYTEKGLEHWVASCSNLELEDRKSATVCGKCQGELQVLDDVLDGKHHIQTRCERCKVDSPPPALRRDWFNKIFEVQGQDFSARSFRLTHARMIRERVGADGKSKEECTINLDLIKNRLMENEMTI